MPFLALIPVKDWIYCGIIVVLMIGFGVFVHHERTVGAAKVIASDQKAVAAQVQRDVAVQTVAALATSTAQGDYDHAITTPIAAAPVPVGLCRPARGSSSVSNAAGKDNGGISSAVSGTEDAGSTSELQRFADAAVTIAHDADAQVIALQEIIAALRSEMENSNAK